MMRRIAVVGDELEDGGAIAAYGGPPCTFGDSGHQVALIGGQAFCTACRSTGLIVKTGGPRRMFFMGEVALDGDAVLCNCPTPRRIVATRAGNAWYEDTAAGGAANLAQAASRAESAAITTPDAIHYDELLIAKGRHAPLSDIHISWRRLTVAAYSGIPTRTDACPESPR